MDKTQLIVYVIRKTTRQVGLVRKYVSINILSKFLLFNFIFFKMQELKNLNDNIFLGIIWLWIPLLKKM